MPTLLRFLLLAAPVLLAVPPATRAADTPRAPISEFEFRLKPGQSERICTALEKGKGLDFRFNADAPVDFDIRYEVKSKPVKPWDSPAVMHQVGRFVAKRSGEHCMVWTATRYAEAGVLGTWQPYAKH